MNESIRGVTKYVMVLLSIYFNVMIKVWTYSVPLQKTLSETNRRKELCVIVASQFYS